jgi:hypothetical protein
LVITVEDSANVCTAPGTISFIVTTEFEDQCGTPFATRGADRLDWLGSCAQLCADVSGPERLDLGESASLTLTASAVDAATLDPPIRCP